MYCTLDINDTVEQLVEKAFPQGSISSKTDYETILRILKIYPGYPHIFYILNDKLTYDKYKSFTLESKTLEELQQPKYHFATIMGCYFAGVEITEKNILKLYFASNDKPFTIECNFKSGEISLNMLYT